MCVCSPHTHTHSGLPTSGSYDWLPNLPLASVTHLIALCLWRHGVCGCTLQMHKSFVCLTFGLPYRLLYMDYYIHIPSLEFTALFLSVLLPYICSHLITLTRFSHTPSFSFISLWVIYKDLFTGWFIKRHMKKEI